jgi:Flp pilus assembly protein TadD
MRNDRLLAIAILMACSSPVWGNPFGQSQDESMRRMQILREEADGEKAAACKSLPAAENTRLGIIRQMLAEGKPHAAIAHLDAARIEAPQSNLLRADGLRQTGRHEMATELYRRLLSTCVAGNAYQGLGLLAGQVGDVGEAVDQLQAASMLLPVDPAVRNDYGYALLLANEHEAALHEFLTAIELAPGHRQAAHNLLLLLYRMGQPEKANQFAEQFGISAADAERLKAEALKPLPGLAFNDAVKPEVQAIETTDLARKERQ